MSNATLSKVTISKTTLLNTIIAKVFLPVSLVLALGVTNSALAADAAAKHQKHNVVSRQTERVKTDTGFTRSVTKTDDAGATATRNADVVVNKAEGTRSATISGTTFEGKTYTGQNTAHKTDTGYVAQGHFTNSDGKVIDRSVNATVDKSAGTVTKEIAVTPQGGETKTKTVVRPLKRNN
jgi:hypothetical protein